MHILKRQKIKWDTADKDKYIELVNEGIQSSLASVIVCLSCIRFCAISFLQFFLSSYVVIFFSNKKGSWMSFIRPFVFHLAEAEYQTIIQLCKERAVHVPVTKKEVKKAINSLNRNKAADFYQ
jgi:hypothetical protein